MRLDHLLSKEHERKFKASVSKGEQVERKHCSILRILKEKECLQKKLEKVKPEKLGGVAQLGEHLLCKQGVRSSILLISTKRAHSSGG